MDSLVLTGYSKKITQLATLTQKSKQNYASKHGYQFLNIELIEQEGVHPAWLKVPLLLKYLPHCDRILWIDADAFITNPETSLDQIPYGKGLTTSRDWGVDAYLDDFSSATMICTQEAIPLFETALKKKHWVNRPLWDQNSLREASKEIPGLLTILPRRTLNAVPMEIHPWVPEAWEEGDFICHLTCASNHDRKKVFKQFAEAYPDLDL